MRRRAGFLMINISEIFYSIQGEGKFLGTPSIFVRTSSCNLRCGWCDSPYTSWEPERNKMEIEDVISMVKDLTPTSFLPHVVVTGGEPFIQKEIGKLSSSLKSEGYFTTVETNGTIFVENKFDFYSISPKLQNSNPEGKWKKRHDSLRINTGALQKFLASCPPKDYQLKFVMEDKSDLAEISRLQSTLSVPSSKIQLMPQGRTHSEISGRYSELVDLCLQHGFRLTPRLHVDIWGDKRGV